MSYFKNIGVLLLLSTILISCSSRKKESTPEERRALIYYGQGTRNLMDKDYTKALRNLLEANNLKPNDSKINTNLGMAYYFKNTIGLALKHLKLALKLDPKNSDARINIATIYMQTNDLDNAEKQYLLILENLIYEKQFRTYYNLGVLELKRRNTKAAIKYFITSTQTNENYCPAFHQLGSIYYKQGNYINALKMFKEATHGTCYENPEPHYMQALTLIKLGRYGMATTKLEKMTERFALTKYEALARSALVKIRNIRNDSYYQKMEAKNFKRNILTPDF